MVKAYQFVRRNIQVNLKKKKTILDLKITNQVSRFETLLYAKCSSGTYISLVEDIAKALIHLRWFLH